MQQLFTVKELCSAEPALTIGGVRHILFHKGDELESAKIVLRVGKKILIDKDAFIDWLRNGGAKRIAQ